MDDQNLNQNFSEEPELLVFTDDAVSYTHLPSPHAPGGIVAGRKFPLSFELKERGNSNAESVYSAQ